MLWAFNLTYMPTIAFQKGHIRDDTNLKGKYFSTLLVVCACDAQNHIVVESKNKDSWTWFLDPMQDAIIEMEGNIVIIFDI